MSAPGPNETIPPTKEEIVDLIDDFLAERRESDGGWAPVTDEDYMDLFAIVYKLIEAKFERDCDYDLPIEVKLVDRNKYHGSHYFNIPYHFDKGEDAIFEALRLAEGNVSIATSMLTSICKEIDFLRKEKE